MTVEVKSQEPQMAEAVENRQQDVKAEVTVEKADVVKVAEEEAEEKKMDEPKSVGEEKKEEAAAAAGVCSPSPVVEKSSSFKEESNLLSDLREHEKKALAELKAKLEEAILGDKLFKKDGQVEVTKQQEKAVQEGEENAKPAEVAEEKEKKLHETPAEGGEEKEKSVEEGEEKQKAAQGGEEKVEPAHETDEQEKPATKESEEKEKPAGEEAIDKEKSAQEGEGDKEKLPSQEVEEEKKNDEGIEEKAPEVDRDISIWGIPLLPSKGSEATDVILLKFLRAREFRVNEAFEMLNKTLQWRKDFKMDSILDEDFDADLGSVAYMNGVDREGHPVCYNIYGIFENDELYNKTFGTEEKRQQFLRWRFQLMEKGIQKLDFSSGGVSSLLQINDLKNSPGPAKKELRIATKQAVALLQDNYPEFVARNIFVNVPFWYYAFNAILSPFLTQRTKSKFVFARPARVTETLLKYIAAEEIPVQYGGLKRENDYEFSAEDGGVSEVVVKAGSTESIEIPAPEAGTTFLWDLTVLGWEVNYKEEFVPTDEGSYTIIVQKGKKMGLQDGPVRNSFRNNEPGKLVLTVENGSFKKKRILYRYKIKKSST